MIKTLSQLGQALNDLYPTRYIKFTEKTQGPYIVYTDEGDESFFADDLVDVEITTVDIDLYSPTKDLIAERRIKDLLRTNKLPYDVGNTLYIQSEGLYMITFTTELLRKYETLQENPNG